ncbi:2Fe-2S iron-sulfur cluster-binding protein [Xenophilus arseniciresistens]|uniref:2Fe-2S iron-sulfur cluster-binding protein n=1 Tax=Xenophilus arseniciresistens TaxID=1283306 RepID=UPI0038CDC9A8
MFHSVRVQPLGRTFKAAPGQPLLRAAEEAGIELPSSCRNGTCRSCLCQRSAGEVRHLIPWPGLSAEEKAEGWLLPCVAEACSDVVLEVPLAFALFDD